MSFYPFCLHSLCPRRTKPACTGSASPLTALCPADGSRNGTEWTDEEVIAYLSTPVMASSVAAGIQDSSPSSNQDAAAQEAVEVPEMLLQRRSKRSRKTPMPQHEEPSENGTTITVSASGGNLEDEFPTF